MKTIEHFAVTAKEYGLVEGALTALPDIFVAGQRMPNASFKRMCMNMHNTQEAVADITRLSPRLGGAWERHRQQDLATHPFRYEYVPNPLPDVPKDSVMLYSGGLDSFVTWNLLGKPKAVYFAIGHKAQSKELALVERVNKELNGAIEIDSRLRLGDIEMSNGYIPYRNLFFIMLASYHSPNVVISQINEYAPDKNARFYRRTEKLLGDINGFIPRFREKKC